MNNKPTTQPERFAEASRQLGCDEREEAFDAALRKVAKAPRATRIRHRSDCAVHNGPALPAGPCDCGATKPAR